MVKGFFQPPACNCAKRTVQHQTIHINSCWLKHLVVQIVHIIDFVQRWCSLVFLLLVPIGSPPESCSRVLCLWLSCKTVFGRFRELLLIRLAEDSQLFAEKEARRVHTMILSNDANSDNHIWDRIMCRPNVNKIKLELSHTSCASPKYNQRIRRF
jgi:hypothetical protein